MEGTQSFSDQLRNAVEKCGKTRYRISLDTGIDQATLSRFVNGQAGMTVARLDILCRYVGARLVVDVKQAKRAAPKQPNPKSKRRE